MIICITGMPGSGKTLVSGYLMDKGFKILEMGDAVRHMMHEEGLEINNINIREYATGMREKHGKDVFARKMVELINNANADVVISGVRSVYEIDCFRSHLPHIVMVAIISPKQVRYMRLKTRGRKDDPKKMSDFDYREREETSWGIKNAISASDYFVLNTGTMKDLKSSIKELMEIIGAKSHAGRRRS